MCSKILLFVELNKMKALVLTILFTLIGLSTCVIITPPEGAKILPNDYIVTLKPGVDAKEFAEGLPYGTVKHIYKRSNGFAITLNNVDLLKKLDTFPQVKSIESDQIMHTWYQSQTGATWGQERVSQRNNTVSGATNFIFRYELSTETDVYVHTIDTGIETSHTEFEGRATSGINYVTSEADTDLNGHGTHVAGTIGSKTYGIAKSARLIAVKVLDANGEGTTSNVIAGINWVTENCGEKKCVINMSLGGTFSQAVNQAVKSAYDAGITCVVAAGNDGLPANLYSPASEPTAITVAASDIDDKIASFSNWGPSVDIIAPGVGILSTWINGGTNTISGTSMACPHVAGLAAYYLNQESLPTPTAVRNRIVATSTPNKITGMLLTPNKLAYNNVV